MEHIFSILQTVIIFVITLGILVFIHELGHFLMAKISGMRVNAFALGMGYRLFGWNKINKFTFGSLSEDFDLQGNCDYRICLLPIGGYCQVAGMVDEAFDTKFAGKEPQPWEFRAKNPFKQALSISGGVLFNVLFAIIFFAIIVFSVGETTYKTTTIGDVSPNSIGEYCGFQVGDRIISVNEVVPANWSEVIEIITIGNLGDNLKIKLNRNGNDILLNVNGKELINKITAETPLGLNPAGLVVVVTDVLEGLAKENGITINDTLLAVNTETIYSDKGLISKLQSNKNQNVTITIKNEKGITNKEFQLTETGTIGVQIGSVFTGEILTLDFNIFQAIGKGTIKTFEVLNTIILSIKQIIVGTISFKSAIGGPVMIAKHATKSAESGIISFIHFTALLSLSLALINILPFPALDGGHLVIIIIEGITRREIPVKAKLIVQKIGIGCLLALMGYVIFNDIIKLF